MSETVEKVKVTIDGVEVEVAKGTNLIEAAKLAEVEVPHYCYHPHLSVAGNCRICKVEVEGMPKLQIGCNTGAADGMVVRTHRTSEKVAEAQRATLEFILVNHPLDCTVCDQAGHCKLQDYYYEYNGKASRFIEEKEKKVKAQPVGPEVVYDGERCILCTRCVRFCDEVTETSELGVLNRGDKAVIAIHPDKPLDNPLSGTVVDLCPVGALTHTRWRFNSRIWYTDRKDTICTGCSTGCNADVAIRDNKVVQVKARLNADVNKEWMCDEGRYGFERFQPERRVTTAFSRVDGPRVERSTREAAAEVGKKLSTVDGSTAIFISPFLTLEEVWTSLRFAHKVCGISPDSPSIAMQLVRRELTDVQKILISPDYAPNARSAQLLGLVGVEEDWRTSVEKRYQELLASVKQGSFEKILLIGDFAVREEDGDADFEHSLSNAKLSVVLTPRSSEISSIVESAHYVLPAQTVNEKSGVMVNCDLRLQRVADLLQPPVGSYPDWMLLKEIARSAGKDVIPENVTDARSLYREMAEDLPFLDGISLMKIGEKGIVLSAGISQPHSSTEIGA